MPYKAGRFLVHLPASVPAKAARKMFLDTIPAGCHNATLIVLGVSPVLPTERLYYLDVESGEEDAWVSHLRAKIKNILLYRIEKKRPPLHRRPRLY